MASIAYTVRALCPDPLTAQEYVDWLKGGHIQEVIKGGALSAAVIRLDDQPAGPHRVEVRYQFADRAALDRYLAQFAPALRADGLKRFPPERGVAFERTVGEIV